MSLDTICLNFNHLIQAMHTNLLSHFALWACVVVMPGHHPKLFTSDLVCPWFVVENALQSPVAFCHTCCQLLPSSQLFSTQWKRVQALVSAPLPLARLTHAHSCDVMLSRCWVEGQRIQLFKSSVPFCGSSQLRQRGRCWCRLPWAVVGSYGDSCGCSRSQSPPSPLRGSHRGQGSDWVIFSAGA